MAVAAAKHKAPAATKAKPHGPPTDPAPFKVTIWTPKPYRAVTARLAGEVPTPTGGGGGWETVKLPRRPPITVWRQPDPLVQSVPIVLGQMVTWRDTSGVLHYPDADALEQALGTLVETFYRGSRTAPPPTVRIACATNAIPYRGSIDWVISNLTWGDAVAGVGGRRFMQNFVVEFTEHNVDERLEAATYPKSSPSKTRGDKHNKRNGTSPASSARVLVGPGDSLVTIAHALHTTWRKLGAAQHPPITDPRHVHVGQKLRIPKGVSVPGVKG